MAASKSGAIDWTALIWPCCNVIKPDGSDGEFTKRCCLRVWTRLGYTQRPWWMRQVTAIWFMHEPDGRQTTRSADAQHCR
jgi:hypothetical protein